MFFGEMEQLVGCGSNGLLSHRNPPIDGQSLERWMLKTLCCGLYCGVFPAADDGALREVAPPVEWLETLFSGRPLPSGQGLFVFHGDAATRFLVDHHVLRVQVMSGKSFDVNGGSVDVSAVIGLRMWVFGIEFRFFAANVDKDWSVKGGMSYRPGRLVGGRRGTQSLELEWGQNGRREDLQVLLSDSGIS